MGSYGTPGESGTHKQIDAECMKAWTAEDGTTYEHTDCKLVGFRNHWSVYRINGEPTAIRLDIISRYRASKDRDEEWFYKPIDETMGPCETDCPISLLDMVPCPDSQYAREWREAVRAEHANKQAINKGLKVGAHIKLTNPKYADGVIVRKRGRTVFASFNGVTYRVPRTQIAEVLAA